MNKAFVREPDSDGRVFCPRCGALGLVVGAEPMDTHVRPESRAKMQGAAWACSFARCEVVYFNQLETFVTVDELKGPIYPNDLDASICACFGFTYDDVEADVRDITPTRIRSLLAKSQSDEARCQTLAVTGQCCMGEIQRLYMKLRTQSAAE